MDLKLIGLDPKTEFEQIQKYISLLFDELFGASAVPSQEQFVAVQHQLVETAGVHWAYKVQDGNRTVAFFTLAQSFSVFAKGKYGMINELWVSPESRGQGVGQQVLDAIKQLAKGHGWLRLDVSAPSPEKWARIVEFYVQNGFEFTGKKLKYLL